MDKDWTLIWVVFLIGQQINVLNRAYFAVRGPDPSLNHYSDYYRQYWPVMIIRGAFDVFAFALLAFHPDIFWKIASVLAGFGVSISEHWKVLLTIPINLTTAFGMGLVLDLGFDFASTKIPKLKQLIPSSQFYQRISQIQAQETKTQPAPPPASSDTPSAGSQKGYMKLGNTLVTLLLITILALCTGWQACQGSQIHKASTTADGIAMSLNNIEKLQESANAQHLISNADSMVISTYVGQSVQINEQLIAQIKAAKSLNVQSADSILVFLDRLASSVDTLNQQGVLHIKDTHTQEVFQSYIASTKAGITSLRQILAASGGSKTSATSSLLLRPQFIAV